MDYYEKATICAFIDKYIKEQEEAERKIKQILLKITKYDIIL